MKFLILILISVLASVVYANSVSSISTVSKEIIRKEIVAHKKEVKICYDHEFANNSDLHGKVILEFDVNDAGNVKNVKINETKSTLKNDKINSCIINLFESWTFSPAPKGQSISISYPFLFK